MGISQAEIARQVGVSRTAVSHVLNGRTHMVGPVMRRRILNAVNAAGYHRNALVRALKANRTHVVGIIVPEEGVSFFTEIIRSAESEAQLRGLQCFLCQSHSQPDALGKHVAALREYRVDGLLIAPASVASQKETIYRVLHEQKFPFVLVDNPVIALKTPFVGTDDVKAGVLATEHLLRLSHRRIACISGYHDSYPAKQRLAGYRQALTKAGVPIDEKLIVGDGFGFEDGQRATRALIEDKVDFTAIVTHSDIVALGAVQQLARHGLRVPQDVSVVGCGNLDVSAWVLPPLTTVDQNPREIGRVAMELLVSIIEGKAKAAPGAIVQPELVVRESSARLAK